MDLYAWIVFVHAAAILLFFIAHGTSMTVAFKLKKETDPGRVRALLELSRVSIGVLPSVMFVLGLGAGIAAGFMGGHWGALWIWISLVLLVIVGGLMTPLATKKLQRIGVAAGIPPKDGTPTEDPEEMRRLIDAWQPLPIAALGLGGFLVILWLMLQKPF